MLYRNRPDAPGTASTYYFQGAGRLHSPVGSDSKYTNVPPEEFRAQIIAKYPRAFQLFHDCARMLEEALERERKLESSYATVVDLLFTRAYQSYKAVYVLAVRALGEDAATLGRRLMEIAFQVKYLFAEDNSIRDERAKRYASWYFFAWPQIRESIKERLTEQQRLQWELGYEATKHLFTSGKGKRHRNWWGPGTIRDLAEEIGAVEAYKTDYRWFSQVAHCTTQGLGRIGRKSRGIEINSEHFVPAILWWATKYMLMIALVWEDQFHSLNQREWMRLKKEVESFTPDE